MGTVVDFADISQEFEETNERYLAELNNEYQSGVDESDGNVFNSLFISRDELEKQIQQIQSDLQSYDTHNAEKFSQQINQINDREELIRLSKSLNNARGFYNIIRLLGHDDLADRLDFHRLNDEYRETTNRLKLLDAQRALDNPDPDNSQQLLDIAIEDVVFDFHKVGEEELRLESINKAKELTKDIRHQMSSNFDHDDKEYVDIFDEFRRLLHRQYHHLS